MVSFDHRDEGTLEADWLASPRWSAVPELEASAIRRLVVVSAHPDDETLGVAGLMHRVARAGGTVGVVVATDGEASHPHSQTHTPAQLRARRRTEVAQAVEMLAPGSSVTRLGLPDGALKHHATKLREGIEAAMAGWEEPVTLVAPWRGDGHGDHRIAGEVAAAIAHENGAQLFEYPIWLWHWSRPAHPQMPWPEMLTLTLSAEERTVKQRAMSVHSSQTAALSSEPGDEVLLSHEFLKHFRRPMEVYLSAQARPDASSLSREYFDDFYAGKRDPWGFETRWYEERKRSLTMAALPRKRFHQAIEVGCSIGVLTEQLAGRCDHLLATDIAEQPLKFATRRLAPHPHVTFRQLAAPEEWPTGSFDLIVLSEIGYYLSADELTLLIRRAVESLADDGVLLACHWRHPVGDYPLSGDQVHAQLRENLSLARFCVHEEEDFLLELFSRPPALSVARETGLV